MSFRPNPKRALLHSLLLLAGIACTRSLFALETDKEQNVIYSGGDSTLRIEGNTRIITIEGGVKVNQGTLQITGSTAVFERSLDSDAINRITITGAPATYQQQLDVDGALVVGNSEVILYYSEDEPVIELVGSAILQQHSDVLNCEAVKYYTDSGVTHYTGPCSGVLGRQ